MPMTVSDGKMKLANEQHQSFVSSHFKGGKVHTGFYHQYSASGGDAKLLDSAAKLWVSLCFV